jgi:hypothetical protein
MTATTPEASAGVRTGRANRNVGMMSVGRHSYLSIRCVALLMAFTLVSPARSQPDDDENDDAPQAMAGQPVFRDEDFDQWVFQDNNVGLAGVRQRLDLFLALHIEDIDRVCKLTDAQKKKLLLTGRGDIKQFFVLYDKAKQRFDLLKNDQKKLFQEIWQDISPLQTMLQFGMFCEDSFLGKALHNTLTTEQFARYDAVIRERRAFRHRAQIELAVTVLEQNLPLRAAQRRELITLFSSVAKPPRKSGGNGYNVVMYRVSQLPEAKLKPLFDDAQWKVVSRQFNQYRGMKQWLKQSGQLSEDDDPDSEPVPAK